MKAVEPRERLLWHLAEAFRDPQAPVVATPLAMGTAGGLFYLSGAVLALVVALTYPASGAALAGELAISAAAGLAGVVVIAYRFRIPRSAYYPMNVAGTTMVTLLVLLAPSRAAAALDALVYLYVPLDSFFFFSARTARYYQTFGNLCVVGLGVAGVLPPAESVGLVLVNAVTAAVVVWLVRAANMAEVDHLTRLPNRTGFQRAVQGCIESANRTGTPLALVLFDLDHFDAYNRARGRLVGDRLLVNFSESLVSIASPGTVVARYDADGFGVLLPGLCSEDAGAVTDTWRTQLSEVHCCSAGVCELEPGDTYAMFADRARSALYEAKQRGRCTTSVRTSHASEKAAIATGLAAGQLVAYYQPIVTLPDLRLVGAEALARWVHPEHGVVGPDRFIPVAEESDLIVDLGQSILRQAMAQATAWPAGMRVSVNASGRELDGDDYAARVEALLVETGLAPSRLVVEVTETLLGNGDQILVNVQRLHRLGVKVALDDFGTGYSSLQRFSSLPVDYVKIDRSFVAEIVPGKVDAPVVAAVCALARATGKAVIAEGIEEPHQADVLIAHGCDNAQGFLYGRPVPAAEFAATAAAWHRASAARVRPAGSGAAADGPALPFREVARK